MSKNLKKSLLVIGGTGFIGQHLVNQALNSGLNVTSVSLNKPKKKNKNVKYLKLDISDTLAIKRKIKNNFNYIVNLSGYIDHSNLQRGGKKIITKHLKGLFNLTQTINHSHLDKFIQIGSSDEYGDSSAPQNESQLENPKTPYAYSRVIAKYFLKMLFNTQQFPYVYLRLFLVYGPGQKKNRFLPQLIRACIKNTSFRTTKGNQWRDFIYVEDLAKIIIKILMSKKIIGTVLNIGSGKKIQIKNVVKKLVQITNSGKPIFGALKLSKRENLKLYPSLKKLKSNIGKIKQHNFINGLKKTVHYYKNN